MASRSVSAWKEFSAFVCSRIYHPAHPLYYTALTPADETYDEEALTVSRHPFALFGVSIPSDWNWVTALALLASFIPHLFFLVALVLSSVIASRLAVCALILLLLASGFNEAILKELIQEPRPAASAVQSYGMPSSHCVGTTLVGTWFLGVETFHFPAHLSLTIAPFLSVCAILLPFVVAWGRWHLEDHTSRQCYVGLAIGTILGFGLSAAQSTLHFVPTF